VTGLAFSAGILVVGVLVSSLQRSVSVPEDTGKQA